MTRAKIDVAMVPSRATNVAHPTANLSAASDAVVAVAVGGGRPPELQSTRSITSRLADRSGRMNRYRIAVHITPRRGILDPQGAPSPTHCTRSASAPCATCTSAGTSSSRWTPDDRNAAEQSTREMCERLLANPVTEDFEIASIEGA